MRWTLSRGGGSWRSFASTVSMPGACAAAPVPVPPAMWWLPRTGPTSFTRPMTTRRRYSTPSPSSKSPPACPACSSFRSPWTFSMSGSRRPPEEVPMRYFPIFLDLRERRVVVVGGGEEALRKVRLLLKSEAVVTLVADRLHPELDGLVSHGAVAWLGTVFEDSMLDGAALVFVAADEVLEQAASTAARARAIPVNVVDRADLSTAITPAIVDRDPLVIAIGTEGAAPVLGQGIRQEIEAMLPPRLGALARRAVALRAKVAARFDHGAPRRDFWRRFFFGTLRTSFLADRPATFEKALAAQLDLSPKQRCGRVALVGAGPGDPELLTLKAQRKLLEADVIVHDRLVGPGILEYARRDAIRIPVGKTPGKPSPRQDAINAILIEEAGKGLNVVRMKGGDPYVLGSGGADEAA